MIHIAQLQSESIHARYGAVMALRKMGSEIVVHVVPLVVDLQQKVTTRLAALEALRPVHADLSTRDLEDFCQALSATTSPLIRIELIDVLKERHYLPALEAIRGCLNDHRQDEWCVRWPFEDDDGRVSTHARAAVDALEGFGGEDWRRMTRLVRKPSRGETPLICGVPAVEYSYPCPEEVLASVAPRKHWP